MKNIFKIVNDVVFVSKLTNTKNKKKLTIFSVLLSQLSAITDISIIAIFSALIADQFTSIKLVNNLILYVLDHKLFILILVIFRFSFQYFQKTIIYKIELDVNKNLKIYILNDIFRKRNFSVADSYFYINVISMHISYFYSSFSNFLNNFLQILAYLIYLVIADLSVISTFLFGILFLSYPIIYILKKSRLFMHESYLKSQEANKEVERVVDNLFLIKILKKEKFEISRFSKIIDSYIYNIFNNYKFSVLNSLLPSFITLLVLSSVLAISNYATKITLDFIGVTLRLFQSLGNLANSINQIINSHVHIEKFYEMEKTKSVNNFHNFELNNSESINFENVTFSYLNSEIKIFENTSFSIPKKSHVLITGPNGSGKSTLLGLFAGIFYPDNGKVTTYSKKFAYIGASPLIFESSLRENILYGNSSKVSDEEILELLKKLDTFKEILNYDLDKQISNRKLSSGQMQKISFVRALVSKPEILLLDESTSNLDSITKNKIFEILKAQNVTILNSTHDTELFTHVDLHLEITVDNENRKVVIT